jgi:hypothetical protein
MIVSETGANGASGAFGAGPGLAGGPGGDGEDAVLLGSPFNVPANEAEVEFTAIAGRGGAGGFGAAGDVSPTEDGGDGGAGGFGGDALVVLQDLSFSSAIDVSVNRTARAEGGDGGFGGFGGFGGDGGDGGDGGLAGVAGSALAEVIGGRIEGVSGALLSVTLSARALGGDGGDGAQAGGAGAGGVAGAGTPSGDGGNAAARISDLEIALAGFADLVSLELSAVGGDAGVGGLGGGEGGGASASVVGNQIRTGGGGDWLIIAADVLAGPASPGGTAGTETVTFANNLFDMGDGHDTVTIDLMRNDGAQSVLSGNVFYGGAGSDLLDFNASAAVVLDYQDNKVKGFETVAGGTRGDRLAGGRDADRFEGGDGGDILDGRSGNDDLNAGEDDDTLNGRIGDDQLDAGAGNDAIDGGKGIDTLRFSQAAGVIADLEARTAIGEGSDQVRRVENLWGSTGDDALTGDRRANILIGDFGADTLNGGGGRDTLDGRDGQDELDGGDGADTYVFSWYADSLEATPDAVMSWGPHDLLDVSGVDADRTVFGDQAFTVTAGGPTGSPVVGVLYLIDTGPTVELHADTNDDGAYDFAVVVETDRTVTAADLVL